MPRDPKQRTRIPHVPIRSPMFEADGITLTRTWVIFFERLASLSSGSISDGSGGEGGPYIRVLLLKDLTVGDDIADHQYIFLPGDTGVGIRIGAVLRQPITADLEVRFRNMTTTTDIATVVIPASTPVDEVLVVDISDIPFADGDVIAADIVASDMSIDPHGICTLTLEWAPA